MRVSGLVTKGKINEQLKRVNSLSLSSSLSLSPSYVNCNYNDWCMHTVKMSMSILLPREQKILN